MEIQQETQQQDYFSFDQEVDISDKVELILKTIFLLEKPYSSPYIIRIVTGQDVYLKNVHHKQLETFGCLKGQFASLEGILLYLEKIGFVLVKESNMGTLEISDTGKAFLEAPREICLPLREIRIPWYDFQIKRELKELRKRIAEASDIRPFQVYTDYRMQQIIAKKPLSIVELRYIPGFLKIRESTARQIVEVVQKIMAKKNKDDQFGMYRKAYSPSHRKVKALFEKGKSLSEIAGERSLQENTVQQYLLNLHLAGEINLKPWIEEKVDSKVLFKAGEYFKQAENARLKDAKEVLGYDYETLEFCRAYVSKTEEAQVVYV